MLPSAAVSLLPPGIDPVGLPGPEPHDSMLRACSKLAHLGVFARGNTIALFGSPMLIIYARKFRHLLCRGQRTFAAAALKRAHTQSRRTFVLQGRYVCDGHAFARMVRCVHNILQGQHR